MGEHSREAGRARPAFIDRYEVLEELGRGGAAVVYRVRDPVGQRELALKQLTADRQRQHTSDLAVLFQREFHTLSQLAHPRIIEVFDFGVDDSGPYYMMELLSGGDLKSRTPLAWKDACRILYDVCSSLALIHARRWVHRDVTPLNVRCTDDGRAKLIDFGAMVPMGPSAICVGTPPFTAPEVIQRGQLDARTDLFSLGATLYYVLTGRNAYPARSFAELPLLWQKPPVPPSRYVELPPQLDALVLSLLRPEPLARPGSAFEVMQRLAALAGIRESEVESVSLAYLNTPNLIAREDLLSAARCAVEAAIDKRGGAILLSAESGLGRSRMLEAFVLEAKLHGVAVLRGRAGSSEPFSLLHKLFAQLFEILPEATLAACRAVHTEHLLSVTDGAPALAPLASSALPRPDLHAALVAWLRELCQRQTLVIGVDDLEGVDESSAVLLAALAHEAGDLRLLVIAAVDASAPGHAAIAVLRDRARSLTLTPLSGEEMLALIRSVFGEVPNLGVVSAAVSRVSGGRPRVAMELLQHLLDRGHIAYRAGQWSLPASLRESDLPRSAENALETQLSTLTPLARQLLELQVLASHEAFAREDYARVLPASSARAVNDALNDLITRGILVSDGSVYRFTHRGYAPMIERDIPAARRAGHHALLANLYREARGADVLRHWLASGDDDLAIERALELVANDADALPVQAASRMPISDVCGTFVAVLEAAQRRALTPRALADLRRMVCALSTSSEERYFHRVAPAWLAQLERDAGLEHYRALDAALDPATRIGLALKQAGESYLLTPEPERVYSVQEAIRGLLHYAVAAIATGSRTQDSLLLESLPALLAPLAGISPIVHAIHQNTLATCEARARGLPEQARARWIQVLSQLELADASEMHRINVIRNAVIFGITSVSVYMGLASTDEWAERIERDLRQRVNVLYMRRVIALQHGDANQAEDFRRRAEIAALQASTPQMFVSAAVELPAHVAAQDLVGVQQIVARLTPLAQRCPGWRATLRMAEGYFDLLREDHASAQRAFESAREIADPTIDRPERNIGVWLFAGAGLLESLNGQQHYQQTRELGSSLLDFCQAHEVETVAVPIACALAIAEAKLGDFDSATARVDRVIALQKGLGVTGVYIGISYETRARISVWAGLWEEVSKFAALAARAYHHGKGSLLVARYERLLDEVRSSLRRSLPMPAELAAISSVYGAFPTSTTDRRVSDLFEGQRTASDRAGAALSVLCEHSGAHSGHLFLNTNDGIVLAASHGASAHSALLDRVRAYMLERQDSGELTAMVTETVHGLHGHFLMDDVQYVTHTLACLLQGNLCTVGAVVLARSERAERALDQALLDGVALKLMQAGDAVSCVSRRIGD